MNVPRILNFSDPVFTLRRKTDPRRFQLVFDLRISLEGDNDIVLPVKFSTDLASTPKLLWAEFAPDGWLAYGSIPHDFGYPHNYFLNYFSSDKTYSTEQLKLRENFSKDFQRFIPVFMGCGKTFCDDLMMAINIFVEDCPVTAEAGKLGLELGGGEVWNKYRKQGPNAYGTDTLGLPGLDDNCQITQETYV